MENKSNASKFKQQVELTLIMTIVVYIVHRLPLFLVLVVKLNIIAVAVVKLLLCEMPKYKIHEQSIRSNIENMIT